MSFVGPLVGIDGKNTSLAQRTIIVHQCGGRVARRTWSDSMCQKGDGTCWRSSSASSRFWVISQHHKNSQPSSDWEKLHVAGTREEEGETWALQSSALALTPSSAYRHLVKLEESSACQGLSVPICKGGVTIRPSLENGGSYMRWWMSRAYHGVWSIMGAEFSGRRNWGPKRWPVQYQPV